MKVAAAAVKSLFASRPDYGKESPEYAVSLTETFSYLTDEEISWLMHPREGLATVCRFLPTAADVHEFLRTKRAKLEEFKPAHTTYRRLNEDHGPWDQETDYERKARVVEELLGYNPLAKKKDAPLPLAVPSDEELRSLRLKTPAAPITKELRALLEAEGWPFIPPQEQAA